ncbi:MAG TPA: hypothetical protein PKD70_14050, partial [Saprospiraceae bacterium]|nr:hypothetical protein [Saprospiraceae bacterium]HMP14996.1 hypothetical protein [Saprospiraceae bacterium]
RELLAGLHALQEAFGDNRKVCHDLCILGIYEHIFQQLSLARVHKLIYFFYIKYGAKLSCPNKNPATNYYFATGFRIF